MDEPLAALWSDLRIMWDAIDPPPADLADMACYALEFATPSTDILRPSVRELAGARGEERMQLVTFDGDSLTIMINIAGAGDVVRIDGWLTPAASHPIELRVGSGLLTTTSDSGGRFAFDDVPRGLTQLIVRTNGSVATPSIVL